MKNSILTKDEYRASKERIDQVGEQVGEAAVSILTVTLLAIESTKTREEGQKPEEILPSEDILKAVDVASVLKISKAKVYKLIQRVRFQP